MVRVPHAFLALTVATLVAIPVQSLLAQQPPPPVRPTVLAELIGVQATPDVRWCMSEVAMRPFEQITARRGPEFVYMLKGQAEVSVAGQTVSVEQGKAVAIPAGAPRTYRGDGRMLSFVLATRPEAWGNVEPVKSSCSERLTGFRGGPQLARFVRVALSPGAQTPVHTHPGPETVYAPETSIVLQTEGRLRWVMGRDLAVVAGDNPLQARNIGAGEAWFLALFIVAEGATFQTNIPVGFQQPPQPASRP